MHSLIRFDWPNTKIFFSKQVVLKKLQLRAEHVVHPIPHHLKPKSRMLTLGGEEVPVPNPPARAGGQDTRDSMSVYKGQCWAALRRGLANVSILAVTWEEDKLSKERNQSWTCLLPIYWFTFLFAWLEEENVPDVLHLKAVFLENMAPKCHRIWRTRARILHLGAKGRFRFWEDSVDGRTVL